MSCFGVWFLNPMTQQRMAKKKMSKQQKLKMWMQKYIELKNCCQFVFQKKWQTFHNIKFYTLIMFTKLLIMRMFLYRKATLNSALIDSSILMSIKCLWLRFWKL